MEFVHENVERDFRLDTAKSMVKSDVFGTLFHCALSCVGVAVTFPALGLWLFFAAQACGAFKVSESTWKLLVLAMIWRYPQLYVTKRDAALVIMRLFDTVSSLIQTSALHEYRFPPELLPTQFYFRAYCIWFGAFFGVVSKQPPVNLNIILSLLHLVGRIAMYNTYFRALVPHNGKMAPAVRWLETRGLGIWTEEGLLQGSTLALDALLGMVLPCWIMYRRELRQRLRWRVKVGLEGSPLGVIGATWPHYIGACIVLPAAALVLSFDPALLPYLF